MEIQVEQTQKRIIIFSDGSLSFTTGTTIIRPFGTSIKSIEDISMASDEEIHQLINNKHDPSLIKTIQERKKVIR